jgi:hypothetical protein
MSRAVHPGHSSFEFIAVVACRIDVAISGREIHVRYAFPRSGPQASKQPFLRAPVALRRIVWLHFECKLDARFARSSGPVLLSSLRFRGRRGRSDSLCFPKLSRVRQARRAPSRTGLGTGLFWTAGRVLKGRSRVKTRGRFQPPKWLAETGSYAARSSLGFGSDQTRIGITTASVSSSSVGTSCAGASSFCSPKLTSFARNVESASRR